MAAHAIWKGVLRFGSVRLPVKLISAVEDRGVHFRLLSSAHGKHVEPVHQKMVESASRRAVERAKVQKGLRMDDGAYVVLTEDELSGLRPKPTRTIETSRFVPASALDPAWFVRPYYLAPDGDEEVYFALAGALREQEVVGLVRWVMRNIDYVGALTAEGGYLVLITLRHAEEIVDASKIPAPSGPALGDRESRMAEQLIEAFQGEFDPKDYRDDYRDRVLAFVEAKSRGKSPKLGRPVTKTPDRSLLNALEKSLKKAKKETKVA